MHASESGQPVTQESETSNREIRRRHVQRAVFVRLQDAVQDVGHPGRPVVYYIRELHAELTEGTDPRERWIRNLGRERRAINPPFSSVGKSRSSPL